VHPWRFWVSSRSTFGAFVRRFSSFGLDSVTDSKRERGGGFASTPLRPRVTPRGVNQYTARSWPPRIRHRTRLRLQSDPHHRSCHLAALVRQSGALQYPPQRGCEFFRVLGVAKTRQALVPIAIYRKLSNRPRYSAGPACPGSLSQSLASGFHLRCTSSIMRLCLIANQSFRAI